MAQDVLMVPHHRLAATCMTPGATTPLLSDDLPPTVNSALAQPVAPRHLRYAQTVLVTDRDHPLAQIRRIRPRHRNLLQGIFQLHIGTAYSSAICSSISFVIFFMVKQINRLKQAKAETEAAPPAPNRQEVLLEEIRDLLKGRH
jgi:hypothetical protein